MLFDNGECWSQESKLRALQYLPDVIKLQRLLVTKYHRRLSRQEALGMNVESFLSSVHEGECDK